MEKGSLSTRQGTEEKEDGMMEQSNIHMAVLAGTFASSGGVFAKLAGFFELTNAWNFALKLLLLGAMITSNTFGCTLFVKAMVSSGSSLPATVASSTVNYVCSALLGWLLFGETTTWTWWCGTSLILLGLLCICSAPSESINDEPAPPVVSDRYEERKQQ